MSFAGISFNSLTESSECLYRLETHSMDEDEEDNAIQSSVKGLAYSLASIGDHNEEEEEKEEDAHGP